MKIYILRHEDRTQDCSFYSPLTEAGLENSIKLIPILEKLNINHIFSSPYIRTLQTIYPFSKQRDVKINLEYGLGEIQHEEIIAKHSANLRLPEYLAKKFNVNLIYKTIVNPEEIKYPEKEEDVMLRVKKFLRDIFRLYLPNDYEKEIIIVLVTHQTVCQQILKIVNKSNSKIKGTIDNKLFENYDRGKITLIYDNDWTFRPIN